MDAQNCGDDAAFDSTEVRHGRRITAGAVSDVARVALGGDRVPDVGFRGSVVHLEGGAMAVATKRRKKRKSLKGIKKLSTLLALALTDLRKQELAKGCVVNMGTWWLPKRGFRKTCQACLAGSVMRWSLCKPPRPEFPSSIEPADYDADTAARLQALNELRCGFVEYASHHLRTTTSFKNRHEQTPDYDEDRDGWWATMKQLLADLRRAGE